MAGIEKLNLHEIEQSIEKISQFLDPCLPLANAHATDFITKSHWDILIPTGVKDELLALSQEQLRNLPTDVSVAGRKTFAQDTDKFTPSVTEKEEISQENTNDKLLEKSEECRMCCRAENPIHTAYADKEKEVKFSYSCLADFSKEAKLCTLEGIGIAVSPQDLICSIGGQGDEIFVGTFMNQKKSHEVEMMSKMCASLAKHLNCRLVVDFGSGKGYLGNHLGLQYGLPVLGIDAAQTNTQSAERRNTVLDKQWQSLARNKMLEAQGRKLTKKEKKKLKEKVTVSEPTDSVDIQENIRQSNSTETEIADEVNRQAEPVLKSKLYEKCKTYENNGTCSKIGIKATEATLNESKFVPCTTFIDKETNFIKLAQLHLPEIFEKLNINENEPEGSRSSKYNQEKGDLVGILSTLVDDVKENLLVTQNHSTGNFLPSDVESSQLNNIGDKNVFSTETCTNKFEISTDKSSCDNEKQFTNVQEVGGDASDKLNIMLTGLHTCGNLASTSMEVFVHSDQLKVLCNVGCCYHLLDEKYLERKTVEEIDTSRSGFPLSKFLMHRKFQLGNTARNLASQSLHRISDFDKLQGERFYPRALLEVVIHDVCGPDGIAMKGMRKLEQKCDSTQEYIKKACDKLGISDKVSDEMIESYTRRYTDDRHRLAAFFQLKTVLAPCIESLIVLDRVCFLLEQKELKDVFLVKMFDPVISPRCYGIVAIK